MVSPFSNLSRTFLIESRQLDRFEFLYIVPFLIWQMQFMLLFSRQGKLRLQKWYTAQPDKAKKKITRDLVATILTRKPKMCSFLEWKELKVVYKRYSSNLVCSPVVGIFHLFANSFHGLCLIVLLNSNRYASLYFCCAIEQSDNELLTLEVIHRYVELLDKYFGSVIFKIISIYLNFQN